MNDKIKQLLENAEQSDAIAKNKWRIENREQLRKERKEKLKELMEKEIKQKRTFEIKMIVTVSTERAIDAMIEMKYDILSGKTQREMYQEEGCDKVIMTFTEVKNDKQQTAVKLYTEEQVRKAIELSRDTHPQGRGYVVTDEYDYSMDEVVDLLTPIELPSDEEIWDRADEIFGRADSEQSDVRHLAFMESAKWMRNKIQGGDQ